MELQTYKNSFQKSEKIEIDLGYLIGRVKVNYFFFIVKHNFGFFHIL